VKVGGEEVREREKIGAKENVDFAFFPGEDEKAAKL
jgi:hypothetical protein